MGRRGVGIKGQIWRISGLGDGGERVKWELNGFEG